MEGQKRSLAVILAGIIYLIFIVGIAGHFFDSLRPLMLKITPYTLLLTSTFVIFDSLRDSEWNFALRLFLAFVVTFLLEVIGVKTGNVFGSYEYGDVLGIKFMEVPLIIGINWVLIILGSAKVVSFIKVHPAIKAIVAGTLTVILDLFIEPVAMKLGYWNWSGDVVPVQNYFAWFTVTFLVVLINDKFFRKSRSTLPVHYLVAQFLFFISLNLLHH